MIDNLLSIRDFSRIKAKVQRVHKGGSVDDLLSEDEDLELPDSDELLVELMEEPEFAEIKEKVGRAERGE